MQESALVFDLLTDCLGISGPQSLLSSERTSLCLSPLQKEGRGLAITAIFSYGPTWASPDSSDGSLPAMEATWVQSLHWEDSLEKEMAVFLPGESHRQRSLEGYSPWGHKESDTTEAAEQAHATLM